MKKILHGVVYDTAEAHKLCEAQAADGAVQLYRTKDGHFFLHEQTTFLDGVALPPGQDCNKLIYTTEFFSEVMTIAKRIEVREYIRPISRKEALRWCITCRIPKCFHRDLPLTRAPETKSPRPAAVRI